MPTQVDDDWISGPYRWHSLWAEVDWHYEPQPNGAWDYQVDDWGLTYNTASPLPVLFCRPVANSILWTGNPQESVSGATPFTRIRLAPNTEYKSWQAQYVDFYECLRTDSTLEFRARFKIVVKELPQRRIARVASLSVVIGGLDWDGFVTEPSDDLPATIVAQVQDKLARLQRWYETERERRNRGLPLITAHEAYEERQRAP